MKVALTPPDGYILLPKGTPLKLGDLQYAEDPKGQGSFVTIIGQWHPVYAHRSTHLRWHFARKVS